MYKNEFCNGQIEMASLNNRILGFCPVVDNEREAVVISDTFDYKKNNQSEEERYSYTVTLRLVNNREFPDKFMLNVYTGIKIWASTPFLYRENSKNFISGKQSATVFVYKENDYLYNRKKRLIGLKYTRDDDKIYRFKHSRDKILSKLIQLDLTDPLLNPNAYNDFSTMDTREVVLFTAKLGMGNVQYGAGLPERVEIFKAFGRRFLQLSPRALIEPVEKTGRTVNKKRQVLEKIEDWNEGFDDYEHINVAKGEMFYKEPPVLIPYRNKIFIEVYSNNHRLVKAFMEFSIGILRLKTTSDKYIYRSTEGYEVIFIPKDARLARGLSAEEQKNPQIRKKEIQSMIEGDEYQGEHVLSFIEVEPFHKLKGNIKKQDPKNHIRNAFKDCGRVTQFINGYESEELGDKMRVVNGAYDLLSAAGFMARDYFTHQFSDQVLLGLSPCKGSGGRLIVLSKIEKGEITYKVFGLYEEDWLPLKKVIPLLQGHKIDKIKKTKPNKILFQQWVRDQLNALPDNSKEHIFFFDASLRNQHWNFATNKALDVHSLRLLDAKGFRFIRVNITNEVPGYNIYKNEKDVEGINKCQGLFSRDQKVFYSVGSKSPMDRVRKDATKPESANRRIPMQQVVEFVVLNEDPDENKLLASRAHALRKLNLTFDTSTKWPLPLFVNDRLSEYLP